MRVPQGGTEENMVLGLFVVHGKLFTTIFLEREFLLQQGFCSSCNSLTLLAIVIDGMTPS